MSERGTESNVETKRRNVNSRRKKKKVVDISTTRVEHKESNLE